MWKNKAVQEGLGELNRVKENVKFYIKKSILF